MRINEELIEIWLNEVCDKLVDHSWTLVRGPLIHDPRVPPIASQHNFIVQPLVTKEWNARAF